MTNGTTQHSLTKDHKWYVIQVGLISTHNENCSSAEQKMSTENYTRSRFVTRLCSACRTSKGKSPTCRLNAPRIKQIYYVLKADRPHPHDCAQTPTDYRHTDKHLRLVALTDRQTLPSTLSPCFVVDKNPYIFQTL